MCLKTFSSFYNSDFDQRQFWTYGCNCFPLGDRGMSDPGLGKPVDNLDRTCKQYKDCLRCARQRHGDECIGEFVEYNYSTSGSDLTKRKWLVSRKSYKKLVRNIMWFVRCYTQWYFWSKLIIFDHLIIINVQSCTIMNINVIYIM